MWWKGLGSNRCRVHLHWRGLLLCFSEVDVGIFMVHGRSTFVSKEQNIKKNVQYNLYVGSTEAGGSHFDNKLTMAAKQYVDKTLPKSKMRGRFHDNCNKNNVPQERKNRKRPHLPRQGISAALCSTDVADCSL